MKIERFEDLECWKKSRKLIKEIYSLTKGTAFKSDFGLRDQIQRASVSILSNIAEGFGDNSSKGFMRFLNYAIRSAVEVQAQLYVALDQQYITEKEFNSCYQLSMECQRMCKGLIKYLKSKI